MLSCFILSCSFSAHVLMEHESIYLYFVVHSHSMVLSKLCTCCCSSNNRSYTKLYHILLHAIGLFALHFTLFSILIEVFLKFNSRIDKFSLIIQFMPLCWGECFTPESVFSCIILANIKSSARLTYL